MLVTSRTSRKKEKVLGNSILFFLFPQCSFKYPVSEGMSKRGSFGKRKKLFYFDCENSCLTLPRNPDLTILKQSF